MKHKYLLTGLLLLSVILIVWLYFFENYRIQIPFNINSSNVNKLIESLSLAYIAAFLFYFIVVYLKEKDERRIIYPFIADYTYVLMNNAVLFSSIIRELAGIDKIKFETTIYNRNINIYPNSDDLKIICEKINPNEERNEDITLAGFKTIPHFFGLMIKFSLEIDYFLDIVLAKSNYMDIRLLRILTDIKTCGYHKNITSYGRGSIFVAKHRHDNLKVFEKSFDHYFGLFRELEKYSEKNLKRYVEIQSLKTK